MRNGITTLFAARDLPDGIAIDRHMQRNRQQECIRFLNQIERAVPAGNTIHANLMCSTEDHSSKMTVGSDKP